MVLHHALQLRPARPCLLLRRCCSIPPMQVWLSTSSTDVHADYLGDAACQVYGSEGKTALLELPGPFKGGSVSACPGLPTLPAVR